MNDLLRDAYAAIVADAPPAPELPGAAAPPPARRRLPAPAIALAAAAVVLVAVGVPYLLVRGGAGERPAPAVAPGAPGWRQGAPPPFSPRTVQFSAPLADGRVLMWGGAALPFPTETEAPGQFRLIDGGIYDPAIDSWEYIEPPPFMAAPPAFESNALAAQLAADRLMLLQFGGDVSGAVYDAATGEWTEITAAPGIDVTVDAIAWTGDTLVLVRLWEGLAPWDVTAPVTARWSLATEAWELGSPPPLSLRANAGVAFDGERIAVWGGNDGDFDATTPQPVADGAIYDVGADTWAPIAAGPPGETHPTVAWAAEGLFVAGSVYDPLAGMWTDVPAPPAQVPVGKTVADKWEYAEGVPQLLTTGRLVGRSGPHPAQVRLEGEWVDTPTSDVHLAGGRLVATTRTTDNPDGLPFRAYRFNGEGWTDLGQAPFTNRMEAGVVLSGDVLVVVGGASGRDLEPAGDAWLLDVSE